MRTKHEIKTSEATKLARESLFKFTKASNDSFKKGIHVVHLRIEETGDFITLPKATLEMFMSILSNMAEGKTVSIVPSESELTTQQAADMLNVSRPHLVKLIESGKIPFKKVGSHRRLLLKDLVAYRSMLEQRRSKSLEFLADQAQELGFGYE